MNAGDLGFFDKVPTKFAHLDEEAMNATGVRVVPPAVARRGSYIAKGVILMPSYVNIGAYVDEGTMVDTWATVGSCAQIGKNVHLSRRRRYWRRAGADAGRPHHHRGQLLHRRPLRGGGRRDRGRKLGHLAWACTSARAPIYDRATGTVSYGRIPAGSVVISGSLPKSRRQIQPVLRRHRQKGGCADPGQDQLERPAARLIFPRHTHRNRDATWQPVHRCNTGTPAPWSGFCA